MDNAASPYSAVMLHSQATPPTALPRGSSCIPGMHTGGASPAASRMPEAASSGIIGVPRPLESDCALPRGVLPTFRVRSFVLLLLLLYIYLNMLTASIAVSRTPRAAGGSCTTTKSSSSNNRMCVHHSSRFTYIHTYMNTYQVSCIYRCIYSITE